MEHAFSKCTGNRNINQKVLGQKRQAISGTALWAIRLQYFCNDNREVLSDSKENNVTWSNSSKTKAYA